VNRGNRPLPRSVAGPTAGIKEGGRIYQSFGWDYQAGYPTAPHFTGMGQKTANIDIRVEPQLVERIDAWRSRQRVPPSRAAAIVYMLDQFLEHDPPELNAAWKRLLSKA
jgi:hypothetical protein